MAPRLVLVHGIGGPRRVEEHRNTWISALVKGGHKAGHSAAAKRLADGDLADVVYAHYGDLFFGKQAQGAAGLELGDTEAALLVEVMAEVIEQHRIAGDVNQKKLARAEAKLDSQGQHQGSMYPVGRAIDAATTLLDAGPWRKAGQWASGKLLVRDLAQVARYLARAEADSDGRTLDERIRAMVTQAIGLGPAIVVAHSLGTVVTYEALHRHSGIIPLWVTLGSPLTMRSVVLPRLLPRPPETPVPVRQWLNFWDRDDIIAARPIIEDDVLPNDAGVRPSSDRVDSDGWWVHDATKYLAQASVAGPVIEALLLAETAQ